MSGRYGRGQHGGRAESLARWREAWRLVHMRGRTHAEAAKSMGISRAAVSYYIKKGRPSGAEREKAGDVIPFAARKRRPDAS